MEQSKHHLIANKVHPLYSIHGIVQFYREIKKRSVQIIVLLIEGDLGNSPICLCFDFC